ncbi:MAG: acyl-CoA dehydrogenase family protein [Deltaproteobacteria bacterium]|nr:acyl-CoA dehydrogenase family protein [Deltaproteobacteria bacterium]
MDFELSPELAELRAKVRAFVDERVLPAEATIIAEDRTHRYDTLRGLQDQAKAEGLFTPHLPTELGGRGLGAMGMCVAFREMGRSPVGARVFNCDAPDQGNMDLLLTTASAAVKERYLAPLCAGEITSAFCMTEPAPGAGADPSNLKTRATRDGDHWVIDGHKWFATGGDEATFLIVMARTSDDPKTGASMFVVDRNAPGVEFLRDVPTMTEELLTHREAEFVFEGVRVGPEAVLGDIGEGFRLAQRRLVPARLTHCMRWLGLADRVMEMCREHLGRGETKAARPYSSMAKVHVAQTLCQVLDDAIQLHGALGYSTDKPFADWYRAGRAARIADGPDEVHFMVIARDFLLSRLTLLV